MYHREPKSCIFVRVNNQCTLLFSCCSTFFVVRMFVRPACLWLLPLELCIADQHLIIEQPKVFL